MIKHVRSSHRRCSMKKLVLRSFTKCTGKHLCQSLFFNKTFLPQACNFIKKETETLAHVFPVNFATFLRIPFLQITSGGCF